ncbi:hypothetical protein GCM10023107_42120 [Actinoplanes octamycinicus]|nr:hypothetical protein Aoc01nite_55250 [Actinoplanes octamycinicus]
MRNAAAAATHKGEGRGLTRRAEPGPDDGRQPAQKMTGGRRERATPGPRGGPGVRWIGATPGPRGGPGVEWIGATPGPRGVGPGVADWRLVTNRQSSPWR